jgi:hypothetical protein
LLLCCARTSKDSETASRIKALLQEGIDWARLLGLARKHRLRPLLYWHLGVENAEAVPKHVGEQLRAYFHHNSLRNLQLTRELLGILRVFETRGIPVIPYKGPTLAAFAYGNFALREFIDLDILVHKQDIPRARELLTSMEYREQNRLTRAQETAFLESQREYVFVHESGSVVELHWAVTPRILSFPLDPESLWRRVGKVTVGGDVVLTFSPEDILLLLCVHGSKHLWYRLAWICDVAELIRVTETMEWEQLLDRASQLGARRMLFLGLFLASDLLGAALPRTVLEKLQTDPAMVPLARQVQAWLFQDNGVETDIFARGLDEASSFHPFRVKIRERLRDKAAYVARATLVPTPEDWELLPLPKAFFPLYYALRPIRLSGRYGQRILTRPQRSS